ncbi:hypothetical protein F9C07_7405 [Aspergillus flavus]|uniref:Uncharacterized protein n=1 Tax=Aspergillus flavus (strain ATCC 200026 / FGSC A1120 / IAM 13836 / NRRL 3357 / JCM 12722 / SRRC 167) TaxID=332952 RepID=A0A7U2QXL0_ASPFN|nr:hypothetical protein F9C07_7405 [Aspergillus flavus]
MRVLMEVVVVRRHEVAAEQRDEDRGSRLGSPKDANDVLVGEGVSGNPSSSWRGWYSSGCRGLKHTRWGRFSCLGDEEKN